jgi:hypothetical protein
MDVSNVEMREKPVIRGDDAKRFLKNERQADQSMADTTEAAKIEAAVRAERARIAALLAGAKKCPPPGAMLHMCATGWCIPCWEEYLEPKGEAK